VTTSTEGATLRAAAPTPRRKTLIFHIGDHKTGSTSIQLAFAKRQVTLAGHGLFYPAKLASNALGDHCTAYGAATTPKARQKAAEPLQKLAARIRASQADFSLISAESFEAVRPELFHEIVQTFFADSADDVRVIGYVRPHAARLLSSFAERTKVGGPRVLNGTLEDFVAKKKEDREFFYLPRFSAWRDMFKDRFLLRPMIRSELRSQSVVEDFVHHAFGGIDFEIHGADQANESLCLEDLMRLKLLQREVRAPRDMRLKLGWEFARMLGTLPPAPTRTWLQLHRSLAEEIRDTYRDDARAMDQSFFDGVSLMETELHHAVDKALEHPQSTEPADHFSASELRSLEIMSKMIAGLLENDEVDWPSFLHKKRLREVNAARKASPHE